MNEKLMTTFKQKKKQGTLYVEMIKKNTNYKFIAVIWNKWSFCNFSRIVWIDNFICWIPIFVIPVMLVS
jgi:hypothetical protein